MKKIIISCMILFVFIIGCERATSPGVNSKIQGTVLDHDGNPVADAKILMNFNIDCDYPIGGKNEIVQIINKYSQRVDDPLLDPPDPPPPPPVDYGLNPNFPNPFMYITRIGFCLENSGIGSLWIEDMFSNEIQVLIENQIFEQDESYCIDWNGKNNDNMVIQNGLYKILLTVGDEAFCDSLFVFKDYNDFTYDNITPLSITNDAGNFTIYIQDLPLNYVGDHYDCDGNLLGDFTVSSYIDIWAFHADYSPVHIDSLLVESGQVIDVLLTFE